MALGALIGPAQVGARAIEMALGRLYHPIWTLLASTVLVAAGLILMFGGMAMAALPLVLYGAGIGIESIARGALPLALFGEARYGTLMGRLALPSLLAQSLAPLMGALQMERAGPGLTLAVLTALSLANVGLTTLLLLLCRRPRADQVAEHVRLDGTGLRGQERSSFWQLRS